MGLKTYKPTTPSLRQMVTADFAEVTRSTPEKSLTKGKKSTGGRNNQGRITTRFRGGGVKRKLRQIDFKRNKTGIPAKVAEIEYDPSTGQKIAEFFRYEGVTYNSENPDEPSIRFWTPDGKLRTVKWTNKSGLHRDNDLPAWLVYAPKNVIEEESYYFNGEQWREGNKPSFIRRDPISGEVTFEQKLEEEALMTFEP